MEDARMRRAEQEDIPLIAEMCHCLWPDSSVEEHACDLMPLLFGKERGRLPTIIFLAQCRAGAAVGFVEVGLRSHADGCDPSHPVGYIERWYVVQPYVGRKSEANSFPLPKAGPGLKLCRVGFRYMVG